ncbi:MAG: hypothetical protein JWQ73_3720, partial [Variovorax sp.]|nr:hypothetical protein [Variovorax sp.]
MTVQLRSASRQGSGDPGGALI